MTTAQEDSALRTEASAEPDGNDARRKAGSTAWLEWFSLQRLGLLYALVLVLLVFGIARPQSFATTQNAASILSGSAALTLVALGIMLPLIVQQYDLSVAYTA